ncbi:unnamed protein product [Linum trigynum]|uniref:Cytochrome f large domain-containing protein n=1 Tax=Linum trigynum TaxID=586398 RepID=A0AAV2F6F2_9ROSI
MIQGPASQYVKTELHFYLAKGRKKGGTYRRRRGRVPQAILPDTVFEAVVRIPYDMQVKQVLANGKKGALNVGAVPGKAYLKEHQSPPANIYLAFGMKMDEQALEPGTDEIRGKHVTGHYTGEARHDRDLRLKYR